MQRWIKLPDDRFIDANRVVIIGRPESFSRFDETGNDQGIAYTVQIGTDFPRASQITVTGTREEVLGVLRKLLVSSTSPPAAEDAAGDSSAAT